MVPLPPDNDGVCVMINLSDVINAGVVYPGSSPSIPEISVIPSIVIQGFTNGAHNVSTAIARPNR